jgi:glycosyltransferase involved in cell wall biosynthesis
LGLRANGYYIVVCRLEPENHALEIIEGFERADTSLPLVILGYIENPKAYVRRLLEHRSNRIRFIGAIYDKEKLGSLRFNARAYIHRHSAGGTNPSLLEAMASLPSH